MPTRRRHRRLDLNAEINVVSLIDVMLLLLVIFMIAAPMMQGGVDIALPKADAKPLTAKAGMVVSIDSSGMIAVDDGAKMSLSTFRTMFPLLAKAKGREGMYLAPDRTGNVELFLQVLGIMSAAGLGTVGVLAIPEQTP